MDPTEVEQEKLRLKAKLEEKRREKALAAEKEELEKEQKRREDGKLILAQKKEREERKRKKEIERKKKEKEADAAYRKTLKEKIEREREARSSPSPSKIDSAAPTTSTQSPTTASEPMSPSLSSSGDGTANLRFRGLGTERLDLTFPPLTTLGTVKETLVKSHKASPEIFFICTHPHRKLTDEHSGQTLKDLQLTPSASLMVMSPQQASAPSNSTTSTSASTASSASSTSPQVTQGWIPWILSLPYQFVASFFASPVPPQDAAPAGGAHGGARGGTRGQGVIHAHSKTTYDKARRNKNLVVVDFSASWCGPCKAIAPTYEQLAKSNPSSTFIHVDIDEMRGQLADLEGVRSIPHFKFFKGGRLVHEMKGANASALTSAVNRYR